MNISSVGSASPVPSGQSIEAKRASLQSMLLRKSLEGQQSSADAISREIEGKGNNLDIRC